MHQAGYIHACVKSGDILADGTMSVPPRALTLTAAVDLFDRGKADTRQVMPLAGNHRGDEAVLRDDGKRNAKDGLGLRLGVAGACFCARVRVSETVGSRYRQLLTIGLNVRNTECTLDLAKEAAFRFVEQLLVDRVLLFDRGR